MANRIKTKSAPTGNPLSTAIAGSAPRSSATPAFRSTSSSGELRAAASIRGGPFTELFVEGGVSGSVPFAKRPQGGRLIRRLLPGDIVISPKLDRLVGDRPDFKARGIHLWLLDLGGDCSGNGISELMLTVNKDSVGGYG